MHFFNGLLKFKMSLKNYYIICAFIGFFPWVSFNLNAFDTQPWFLLSALPLIYIAFKENKNHEYLLLIFVSLAGMLIAIDAYQNPSHAARGFATYLSLVLSILLFNRYVGINQSARISILLIVNLIWLLYSMLQIIGVDHYLNLVQGRTSETRGFTSLAAEPTFFGIFLLFQIIIITREQFIYRIYNNKSNPLLHLLLIISLIQIVFVAQSSMAMVIGLTIVFLWFFIYRPFYIFPLIAFVIFFYFVILMPVLSTLDFSTRPLILLSKFTSEPSLFFVLDRSVNERLSAIYISVSYSFNNFLVPQGTLRFEEVSNYYYSKNFWISASFGNKIMSFIGALIFELGFISIFLLAYIFTAFSSVKKYKDYFFWMLTLLVMYLTAIPIGFPMTGYLLAIVLLSFKMPLKL